MRTLLIGTIAAVVVLAAGCAAQPAPLYAVDYGATDSLKRANLSKTNVGRAQPTDPDAKINTMSLRASRMVSASGSFATYVAEAMTTDFKEAGLYDAASPRHIDITLQKNDIDISGFSEGYGLIEADFRLMAADKLLFRKTFTTKTTFESSFMGAVAITKGRLEYPVLVHALLGQVYADPEFLKAMRAP